ncbi:MAG: AAA family ATPase [Chloroflexi bacterium]|nr:AAA family ATPase [Chloroflexota bacterium]MDQ3408119.1 AAA family ATPase [Chloroflexota bacterium]
MRQLYLAATGMNRGKTTVSLGLLAALIDRGLETGFIKPVGQRYAMVDGVPADEDAILMKSVFGLPDRLEVMSPVHIPRGFTKSYISGSVTEDLAARIGRARGEVSRGRDVLLIEGTGHAGVGAVIDLSNADVARALGAPAVIVSEAGVGRPIDEIVLNHALFTRHGVEVVGAVINKVDADAHPSLPGILRAGLARHGIDLLGMLPYRPLLSNPTLSMLVEQMPGEVLHPGADLDRVIEHVAIGAMQPRHLLERIGPGSLLIVPGDREDVIQATVAANRTARTLRTDPGLFDRLRNRSRFGRRAADPGRTELAGMLFTGGYRPRPRDLEAIRAEDLFAHLVEEDTYAAASGVHDLLVKIHAADTAKIALIKALVAEHLDVDRLLEASQRPDRLRVQAPSSAPALRSTWDSVRDGVRRVFRSDGRAG